MAFSENSSASIDSEINSNLSSIENVVIVGAGWTGRQIAGQMLSHGLKVAIVDRDRQAIESSKQWIDEKRDEFAAAGAWPACTREQFEQCLFGVTDLESIVPALGTPDLILESVNEQFSLKRRVLQQYSTLFAAPTIIASNSSYFVPSLMQKHVVAPERFANFHFHVPVWRATLVDIATGPLTDESTVLRLTELAQRIGQTPLVQRVENPGYIFNWMLRSLLQSSLQLLAKGVATPADIDLAWTKVTGMPIGPFGWMDQIGVDLIHQTMSHARFVDGDAQWQGLLDQLQPLIDAGHLGMKTGKGFFEYPRNEPMPPNPPAQ